MSTKKNGKKQGLYDYVDGWTDRKRRSICNFLVNSPKGTVFSSSIDTSEISKTADKVLEMLDAIVEKVGEENVVQIVTDNAANYKAAGLRLMEKRPKLFWTPCAAHCIDLMLEDLDKKISIHGVTITKARKITTYIYSRTLLHCWMKEFTKDRELIRPAVTRFATSYLTLRCLNEQKGPLLALFASDKWKGSKFGKSVEGKNVQRIVLNTRGFWPRIITCLRAALPLVKVLRMVDSDENPAMGFIYEAMTRAKDQIKENFNHVEKNYKPVWDIIDERWEAQMQRPLHAAAYYLNPQFQYSPDFKSSADVKMGLYTCLERMVSDPEERTRIDLQMDAFKNARGLFGLPTAINTRTKKTPADWWDSYGDDCPELKKFAIRILSLTCSSSGCERNWSAFEMVHTKKRNRLHQQKMNDLVFIMYNLRLQRKKQKRAIIQESIILEDLPSDDEWITEREEPLLPFDGAWLNALDRAAKRSARERASRIEEQNNYEDLTATRCPDENLEYEEISDDDIEEVAATLVGSNEFDHVNDFDMLSSGHDFDAIYKNENRQIGMGTTGADLGSDEVDDRNFGYED
ncbi:uncharacterized protein LOC141597770 [Silene latifolia]|uniref:uncharacterized protein LOC141597770 n=1 Tax=Silene latifolia TaxID=37657 RepID=UPI003D76AB0D